METRKSYKLFRFENDARWTMGRECVISKPGNSQLRISSPPEFKGQPGIWTPEDMFLASVNVCTLLGFVAYANHKNLDLVAYESSVEGILEYVNSTYRFTGIILRPNVTVKSPQDVEAARAILADAHRNCLVSNSVVAQVEILPEFHIAPAEG